MYFILTSIAAIIATIAWYVTAPRNKYQLHVLCFIYWVATLMWLCDHIIAYLREGGAFFDTSLDATLLGLVVVICGAVAWLIYLFIRDPKGVFQRMFRRQQSPGKISR